MIEHSKHTALLAFSSEHGVTGCTNVAAQVFKNWRRKSCAGLSVEMFVVVLSAAVTYCASILIRCGGQGEGGGGRQQVVVPALVL